MKNYILFMMCFLMGCSSQNNDIRDVGNEDSEHIDSCQVFRLVEGEKNCLDDPCWDAGKMECKTLGCLDILGRKYDIVDQCFLGEEWAGCAPKDTNHINQIHFAEDTTQSCWQFPNQLIPKTWTPDSDWEYPEKKHPSGCQVAQICPW